MEHQVSTSITRKPKHLIPAGLPSRDGAVEDATLVFRIYSIASSFAIFRLAVTWLEAGNGGRKPLQIW